jgi:hypothetical protein
MREGLLVVGYWLLVKDFALPAAAAVFATNN